jgi:hypothetical protein
MLPPQYYGMPGAPPPSWSIYPPPQAGQHTPASGTPQPQLLRSQNARSMTPQQQGQQQHDGYSTTAMHTPGWCWFHCHLGIASYCMWLDTKKDST